MNALRTLALAGASALTLTLAGAAHGQSFGFGSPRVIQSPVVIGSVQVGQTLTAPAYSGVTYQWTRNGSAISGATGRTYVVQAADIGQPINFAIFSATATSQVPASPTVAATPGNAQVSLAVTENGAGSGGAVSSHKLYCGAASGSEALVGPISGSSPFVQTGLTNGTSEFCQLTSVNAAGEGPKSAEVQATPLAPYLGEVATGARIPNTVLGGAYSFQSRSFHIARDNITSVQIVLPYWYWTSASNTETAPGSGDTVAYTASIEYPVGTFTQVLFSGATSGSAANNTNLVSDAVAVTIPNGAQFWVRVHGTSTQGIVLTNNQGVIGFGIEDSANGEGFTYSTSSVTDQTMSGTVANSNGVVANFYPAAIIANTSKPSVCEMGDSRVYGFNDAYTLGQADIGETARSIGTLLANINEGSYQDTVAKFDASHTQRVALTTYCSTIVDEYGINDIRTGVETAAQLESNLQTEWGYYGSKPIYRTTMTPVSTSIDGFASLAGQTANSYNSVRAAVNDYIRTTPSPLRGYFDVSAVLETAIDSGFWKTNGAAGGYTVDGLHANPQGDMTIQNSGAINPALIMSK